MAVNFSPDLVEYGDKAGLGAWLIGHGREHDQFAQLLAQQATPVLMPVYPLYDMGDNELRRRVWLETHSDAHVFLRTQANITGLDLSVLDSKDSGAWYIWMDTHRQEHILLRQFFGIT